MFDVVAVLKKVLDSEDMVAQFAYRLEIYQGDFPWARDQMLALWKYCSEFNERQEYVAATNKVVKTIDYFFQFALIASREKMLRSIDTKDRGYWRAILANSKNEKTQKKLLTALLMDKRGDAYLKDCAKRFDKAAKPIQKEIRKFVKDLEQPAVDLGEKFNTLCRTFSSAIETGRSVLVPFP